MRYGNGSGESKNGTSKIGVTYAFHRFIVFVIAFPPKLLAWAEGGHHLIAAVAFSLLSDEEKTEMLQVLSKHPRF